jgi:3-deoxy-manno-octulosonate cytidylyltransferase (CMP-KDO synthetase)
LLRLAGKSMLQRVHEIATASGAQKVLIATDDERIDRAARGFGASVCMTSSRHGSGSDRVAEAARCQGWSDDTILVNLQGDEPMMPAVNIRQVAENLQTHHQASIATLCVSLDNPEEFYDCNVVKVVRDKTDFALYFSRAAIPVSRVDSEADMDSALRSAYRHIGLYAYRLGYLQHFTEMDYCSLEVLERLEQLRALWHGHRIHVAEALQRPGPGVDTAQDLSKVERLLAS